MQSLLAAAEEENKKLDAMRVEIDAKTQIMINKLGRNKEVLDSSARASLLTDINELETVLGQNERKFYKNQSYYEVILQNLKERLFNMTDLENKLLMSESQRLEERNAFRQKILTVFIISLGLGLLALGSLYFGSKLKIQKKELIKANAEVERMNEDLENLVYQRTKSLEDANHEMDVFLYKASHDLRGPISTIMGLCHVAKLSKTEGLEIFGKVLLTAYAMDKILIKLNFINEINHPSNYSLISFGNKIEVVRKEYEEFIKDNAITFTTDFPKDLSFYSYPAHIATILDNLVDNALFYTSLKKQGAREVGVKAVMENDHVEIGVYDNGVGIDPAIRERLWEMFFVGNEDSTGKGIGLYIVKKSVEALKGHISFESEQYVFTRFVVTIPINKDAHAPGRGTYSQNLIAPTDLT